jgi:hypothetical protein
MSIFDSIPFHYYRYNNAHEAFDYTSKPYPPLLQQQYDALAKLRNQRIIEISKDLLLNIPTVTLSNGLYSTKDIVATMSKDVNHFLFFFQLSLPFHPTTFFFMNTMNSHFTLLEYFATYVLPQVELIATDSSYNNLLCQQNSLQIVPNQFILPHLPQAFLTTQSYSMYLAIARCYGLTFEFVPTLRPFSTSQYTYISSQAGLQLPRLHIPQESEIKYLQPYQIGVIYQLVLNYAHYLDQYKPYDPATMDKIDLFAQRSEIQEKEQLLFHQHKGQDYLLPREQVKQQVQTISADLQKSLDAELGIDKTCETIKLGEELLVGNEANVATLYVMKFIQHQIKEYGDKQSKSTELFPTTISSDAKTSMEQLITALNASFDETVAPYYGSGSVQKNADGKTPLQYFIEKASQQFDTKEYEFKDINAFITLPTNVTKPSNFDFMPSARHFAHTISVAIDNDKKKK